jgi:hypothetical protein
MKKQIGLVILAVLVMSILVFLIQSTDLSSAEATDPATAISSQFGIDQNNIPTSIEDIKAKYLQEQWIELIKKNKYVGPVHTFFTEHPTPFKVIFGEPYTFTLTFALVFFFWFLVLGGVTDIAKNIGILKKLGIIAGVAFAIIFAQIGILREVSRFTSNILLAENTGIMRTVVWLAFLIIIVFVVVGEKTIVKIMKKNQQLKEKEEVKQGVKESQELIKGIKEGKELTK